ncbi:hypothetical protein H4219_004648 [Mycoemilia scoparia]|uniref:Secreted protein n=1 Tax=Mycoemilia scoparia TaxID=417184 RepID=A0A9W8DR08_9FUNG|nr:hypothetical protein H4219_004648 [Mycoemilia scoparia]
MKFYLVAALTATILTVAVLAAPSPAINAENDFSGLNRRGSKLIEENGLLGGITGSPKGILCSILASLGLCKQPKPAAKRSIDLAKRKSELLEENGLLGGLVGSPQGFLCSVLSGLGLCKPTNLSKRSLDVAAIVPLEKRDELLEENGLLGGLVGSPQGFLCSVLAGLGLCKPTNVSKRTTIMIRNGNGNGNGNGVQADPDALLCQALSTVGLCDPASSNPKINKDDLIAQMIMHQLKQQGNKQIASGGPVSNNAGQNSHNSNVQNGDNVSIQVNH